RETYSTYSDTTIVIMVVLYIGQVTAHVTVRSYRGILECVAINLGVENPLPERHRYGSFLDRYPDCPQWVDGNVWELDIATEIHESLNSFVSSMHYQAKAIAGMKLRTRQEWRGAGKPGGEPNPARAQAAHAPHWAA